MHFLRILLCHFHDLTFLSITWQCFGRQFNKESNSEYISKIFTFQKGTLSQKIGFIKICSFFNNGHAVEHIFEAERSSVTARPLECDVMCVSGVFITVFNERP